LSSAQFRIAFLYVTLASLWIWLSDHAVALVVHNRSQMIWAQSAKGWLFVLLTGLMLYWLIGRDLKRLAAINRQLVHGHEQALRVLVSAMDIRHKETRDHSDRVMRMAMGLARLTGMQDDALLALKFGALLHDIGKLAIPDAILIKPGKLDEAEMAHMRRHPEIGRELMEQVDFLRKATDIPYAHHERWDGTGYPRGLRGEDIPLAARIFSIVDVWDALSFPRVYKPAWPEDEVLAYLRDAAGSQLDPQLVQLFLDNHRPIKALGMVDATVPMEIAHA